MTECGHLDQVRIEADLDSVKGCEVCLATGGTWVHLRMCLTCGFVGCCDDSPGTHARLHAGEIGHPLVQSAEPGERWAWCYPDEVLFKEPPPVAGEAS